MTTRAVSENWLAGACRGLTATLERLRVDRQLEEALTHGADPLHLALVFGIDEKTAIRYRTRHDSFSCFSKPTSKPIQLCSPRTHGSTSDNGVTGPAGSR